MQAAKARAPTPEADDEQQPTTTKPKRASRKAAAPKRRSQRKQKADEPPPTSSPQIELPSTRTEIDPITAAAAHPPLTPSSSASSPPTAVEEAEAEIDPNVHRSKRQKRTPSPHRTRLSVRREGDAARQLPPSSPVLPAFQLGEQMQVDESIPSTPGSTNSRIRASFNKETGIFSIQSSPGRSLQSSPAPQPQSQVPPSSPPQQPIRRNAFALLGKKKEAEKPPAKKSRGKKEEKEEDMEFEDVAPKMKKSPSNQGRKKANKSPPTKNAGAGSPKQAAVPASKAPETTNKPIHPFFSAAGRKNMQQPPPAIDTKKTTTLVISPPRRSPKALQGPKPNFGGLKPAFGLSAADREPKLPGMVEAPWPVRGTSHIRGLKPSDVMDDITFGDETVPVSGERKLKDVRMVITPEENILSSLARKLDVSTILADIHSDDYEERKYFEVPAEVRVPQRLITTGSELQEMVRPRVSARLPHPKALYQQQDEDSDTDTDMALPRTSVHPALLSLYKRLGTELTPFDLHKFETSSWEVKYAPQKLAEVLQLGREPDIIRDWLTELRTDKVHVGGGGGKGKRKAKPKATAAKKKRKKGDLDGFVVDSEEESDLMNEIAEPEEDDWLNPASKTKKSSVRAGDKMAELLGKNKDRKTNTIVISGPTGCGKTAAVYAAAKELGYAVFEVNSGTRRSGKDVLDMVGDMSRNHQVSNKSVLDSDNPFTRAKAPKAAVIAHEEDLQMRQRQSLILFEEVDILFEEDKSFWTTVISLMAQSKRPIVLTCNDESLLPWDDLSLHAILRFSAPPRDLLVDHLVLMAANEGHLLQRPAIDALVQANGNDIRACIMELQFYCRMAVGDRKAGLSWLIDRFPVGCDIASNGEKTRVVSVDTYRLGMGMVPHSPDLREDDRWQGLWEEYGDLDLGDRLEECGTLASLEVSEAFFEARSAADAFAPLSSDQVRPPSLLWQAVD
jgi:hypothetical protein